MIYWIFALIATASWAENSQELIIDQYQFIQLEKGASCALLEERKKAREIILSELEHSILVEEVIQSRNWANYDFALQKKLFYAPEEWTDDFSFLSLTVEVPADIQETEITGSWKNWELEVHGAGIHWRSKIRYFPIDVKMQLSQDGKILNITYPVFGGLRCLPAEDFEIEVHLHSENKVVSELN